MGTGLHWLGIGSSCIFLWKVWWNLELYKTEGIWLAERLLTSHEKLRCTDRISYVNRCVLWTGPWKESQRCDARAEGNNVSHMQRENMTRGTAVAYPTGSGRRSLWARFWPVCVGTQSAVNQSSLTLHLVMCFNWTLPLRAHRSQRLITRCLSLLPAEPIWLFSSRFNSSLLYCSAVVIFCWNGSVGIFVMLLRESNRVAKKLLFSDIFSTRRVRKVQPPQGFNPRTVQTISSRHNIRLDLKKI